MAWSAFLSGVGVFSSLQYFNPRVACASKLICLRCLLPPASPPTVFARVVAEFLRRGGAGRAAFVPGDRFFQFVGERRIVRTSRPLQSPRKVVARGSHPGPAGVAVERVLAEVVLRDSPIAAVEADLPNQYAASTLAALKTCGGTQAVVSSSSRTFMLPRDFFRSASSTSTPGESSPPDDAGATRNSAVGDRSKSNSRAFHSAGRVDIGQKFLDRDLSHVGIVPRLLEISLERQRPETRLGQMGQALKLSRHGRRIDGQNQPPRARIGTFQLRRARGRGRAPPRAARARWPASDRAA